MLYNISSSAIAEHAAGWVSYGQKWKTGTGRLFTDIIGLYSTNVTYLASKAIEFHEKNTKYGLLCCSRSPRSVLIESPYDFILVINSN